MTLLVTSCKLFIPPLSLLKDAADACQSRLVSFIVFLKIGRFDVRSEALSRTHLTDRIISPRPAAMAMVTIVGRTFI